MVTWKHFCILNVVNSCTIESGKTVLFYNHVDDDEAHSLAFHLGDLAQCVHHHVRDKGLNLLEASMTLPLCIGVTFAEISIVLVVYFYPRSFCISVLNILQYPPHQ